MTTQEITMEEAKTGLMNYNSVKDRFVHELNIEFNITILSVNDDNTVDWIHLNSKQHSKIKIINNWVFLEFSKVGGIIEEGDGIFIIPEKVEKYLK